MLEQSLERLQKDTRIERDYFNASGFTWNILKIFSSVFARADQQMEFRSRQLLCNTNLGWIAAFMIVSFFISTAQNLLLNQASFVERKAPHST